MQCALEPAQIRLNPHHVVIVALKVDWHVSVAETSTSLTGQEPQIAHKKLPKAHRRGRTVDAGEIVAPTECFSGAIHADFQRIFPQ
jgi:hypothetical protein